MLLVKPEDISFDTQNDIIDYITKGLPPRKQDFQRVMSAYMNPYTDDIVDKNGNPIRSNNGGIIISTTASPDDPRTRAMMESAMKRVYENKCRNRNVALGIAGIAALVAIRVAIGGCGDKKDKEKEK